MDQPPPEKKAHSSDTAAPMHPYSDSLPLALLRGREAVMERLRPTLRRHDITEQQWRILRTLLEVDEIETSDLAHKVCLLPSSLSRILRSLGERQLIRRRVPAQDLRRVVISISDEGRRLIDTVAPAALPEYEEILRLYGRERTELLKLLLRQLEEALAE